MSSVNAPDNFLGSYTGSLDWNPSVLTYISYSGAPPSGFAGSVNAASASTGHIAFNGASATGATGNLSVLTITFNVVGAGICPLDLNYTAMAAAVTFGDLRTILTINDGSVTVPLPNYALTVNNDGHGTVTLNPTGGNYPAGTVVTLTPAPNSGYRFSFWSGANAGDVINNTGIYTIGMSSPKTVTANFELIPFTLTMAASPSGGGTISPTAGGHEYAPNTVVDISATPATGHRFVNWSSSGGAVADPSNVSTTVTVEASKTVTAHFEPIPYVLTMASNPEASGTTSPAAGGHTYDYGTLVNISATPTAGYRFVNWSSSGSSVTNPNSASTTVTVEANKTVIAHFELIPFTLTMAASPGGSGITSPTAGGHDYAPNTVVNISATPATGYRFVNWSSSGGAVADPSNVSTTVTVEASKTVTAHFEPIPYILTMASSPEASGTTSPAAGGHTYVYGTVVNISATPAAGYRFVNWSSSGSSVANPNSASTTVTVETNKTVTALFAEAKYTLIAGNDGHGTVELSPADGPYAAGTKVTLTPKPNPGYRFSSWTGPDDGDVVKTGSTYSIVMNSNKSVTALFDPILYKLMVSNDGHGGVTLSPEAGSYTYGTIVTLTPTPNSGYSFASWSGTHAEEVVNTGGVYTLVMNGDKAVQANFTNIFYTLTAGTDGHGNVLLSPPGGTYASGTTVTLTFVPDSGYSFSYWSGMHAGDIVNSAGVYSLVMNSDKIVQANFAQVNYTLTVGNDTHGSVTLSPPGGTYAAGTVVTLTPMPNSGYSFASWSGTHAQEVVNTGGVYTLVMNDNKLIAANFSQILYSLVTASNGQGSVILSPSGGVYAAGTVVTLAPTPNFAYVFSSWSGTDVDDIINTGGVYTLVMDGNKSITANFNQVLYTLTAAVDGQGAVTLLPPGGSYAPGTTVTVTPTAGSGYAFVSWNGANYEDILNTGGVYTILMDGHKSITAHFGPILYSLSVGHDGYGSVLLSPSGGTYASGTIVTLTPMPNSGYIFNSWSGTSSEDVMNMGGTYTIVMNDHKSITAQFNLLSYALTVDNSGQGSVALSPSGGLYTPGTTVTLSPVPHSGFLFNSWSGRNALDIVNTGGVYTIVMNGDKSVQANFSQVLCTLTAGTDGYGSIILSPPGGVYASGTTVSVTPVANSEYAFSSWSGTDAADIVQNGETFVIVMNSDKAITAHFGRLQYHLTVDNDGHGSVRLAPSGGIYLPGISLVLTPIPDPGYSFSCWTGPNAVDIVSTSGVYTIMMNNHKTVQANFVHITYELTMAVSPADGGVTTPYMGISRYAADSTIAINALPADGYQFIQWSQNVTNPRSASTVVTLDSNKTVTAYFSQIQETVSIPVLTSDSAAGYRGQLLTFSAEGSKSSIGHEIEYQFDWGDGSASEWHFSQELSAFHATKITASTARAGLPAYGQLIDCATGMPSGIRLAVVDGFLPRITAGGFKPNAGTDADKVFSGMIDCSEAMAQNETVDIPLVLSLSGMDIRKRYVLTLFCNLGSGGWEQASLVTLAGADGFVNESSMGIDDTGQPIFSGKNDPSTRIPSDNTASGYVVRFTNVLPGSDGQVELTISFDGQAGHEYKGKCTNGFMLQEFDLHSQEPTLTAYNDHAYTDLIRSHRYAASGTYAVRARARCKTHPEILSEWSEGQNVEISGITIDIAVDPANSGEVRTNPEQADYDFGSSVEVSAVANAKYKFSNWNHGPNDTSKVITVHLYSSLYLNAHFTSITGLPDKVLKNDLDYLLLQNYPNPFNPETIIFYRIPESSRVTLRIYNTLGREITTLVNGLQPAGNYHLRWDTRDDEGRNVDSGLYLCRIEVNSEKNNYIKYIKMVLVQ